MCEAALLLVAARKRSPHAKCLCHNVTMNAPEILARKFYRTRSRYWRDNRMLFPSPAEVEFIKIMGGKTLTLGWLKSPKTGFPLTFILTMGASLKAENVKREVRVGKYWLDFGSVTPYYNKGIEVDGAPYHTDIVIQQERDDYFRERGWQVLHIPARHIYNNPDKVQDQVLKFLGA